MSTDAGRSSMWSWECEESLLAVSVIFLKEEARSIAGE